ncbi:MAG TPA: dephospho-CoA kinase [Vicinamibacterales bacterium]|nr:dephospho-CoA kinase [Vicinamibacterales bacterium]
MATLRVALTGGIATGKSHCLQLFTAAGVPTIDADRLAHEAIAPGTPGHAAVVERFGRQIVTEGGAIDRPALAAIVFGDAAARRDLEAIVHPRVYRGIGDWFGALGDRGEPLGIADIPLLYETGRDIDYDTVIVASCPPAMQIARLMQRSGLSRAEAEARLAAQLPIDAKAAKADHVIDTSGTLEETENQVRSLLEALRR